MPRPTSPDLKSDDAEASRWAQLRSEGAANHVDALCLKLKTSIGGIGLTANEIRKTVPEFPETCPRALPSLAQTVEEQETRYKSHTFANNPLWETALNLIVRISSEAPGAKAVDWNKVLPSI